MKKFSVLHMKKTISSYEVKRTKTKSQMNPLLNGETNLKRDYSIVLSKWLYYALIALFLGIIIVFDIYAVSLGNEMAERFLPTLSGLAFTFSILVVFFDLREELEWKTVKKSVYSAIEMRLRRYLENS